MHQQLVLPMLNSSQKVSTDFQKKEQSQIIGILRRCMFNTMDLHIKFCDNFPGRLLPSGLVPEVPSKDQLKTVVEQKKCCGMRRKPMVLWFRETDLKLWLEGTVFFRFQGVPVLLVFIYSCDTFPKHSQVAKSVAGMSQSLFFETHGEDLVGKPSLKRLKFLWCRWKTYDQNPEWQWAIKTTNEWQQANMLSWLVFISLWFWYVPSSPIVS